MNRGVSRVVAIVCLLGIILGTVSTAATSRARLAGANDPNGAAAGWTSNGTVTSTTQQVTVQSDMLAIGAGQFLVRSNSLTQFSVGAAGSSWLDCQGGICTFASQTLSTSFKASTEDGLVEKLGSSASTTSPIGGLANRQTPVGSVNAAETDLQSVTLAANGLTTTGHCVGYKFAGINVNNANAKTVKVYYGTTAMLTAALTISIAGQWFGEASICRTGSSAQRYFVELREVNPATGLITKDLVAQGTLTETETNSLALKLTGTATTTNDVTQNIFNTWVY